MGRERLVVCLAVLWACAAPERPAPPGAAGGLVRASPQRAVALRGEPAAEVVRALPRRAAEVDEGEGRRCGVWPSPGAGEAQAADRLFPEGFASAEVRSRSAVIWARVGGPSRLRVRISAGPRCAEVVSAEVVSQAARGHAVEIPLSGLRPGTRYRYRLEVVGGPGPTRPGWFTTAPERDAPVRLAFSADVSERASMHGLIDDLIAARPEVYLSLGDWPYSDLKPPAERLDDFRARHAASRAQPWIQAMTRAMPIHAVWDDHEILNDWDGRDGLKQPARVAAGVRAWKEFFPVAGAPPGEIYRRYRWGPEIEVFQLDCRSHRHDNLAPEGAGKTMLGAAQLKWLLDGLAESEAAFKLIVTTVPLDHGTTGLDHWIGFQSERQSLLDHLVERQIGGVVFLTADQHWLSVHHLQEGFKVLQVGPLAQFLRHPSPDQPPWVLLQKPALNFGLIDYTPGVAGASPPTLSFKAIGEGGQVLYQEEIQAGVGQIRVRSPSPWSAWSLEGAHRFYGHGDQTLRWATPGAYTIRWTSTLPGALAPAPQTLVLEPGRSADFIAPGAARDQAEGFEGGFGGRWREAVEGQEASAPVWAAQGGAAVAARACRGKADRLGVRRGASLTSASLSLDQGVLAARVMAPAGAGLGLSYGARGARAGYRVMVDVDQRRVWLVRLDPVGGAVLADVDGVDGPVRRWAVLSVERRGARHRVALGGAVLIDVEDDTYGAGGVALQSWGAAGLQVDDVGLLP